MRTAYAVFLCRNDGYLPGALTLAYALRQQTKQEILCLVTENISHTARRALRTMFGRVIPIDELRSKSTVTEGRSDRDFLPARFQALRLGPDGDLGEHYDKIILLDADILPLERYDELFSLDTPAGILMESKAACYTEENDPQWSWHRLYEPVCPHGARIPKEITDRVRRDPGNMGVNSAVWVLTPSMDDYRAVLTALRNQEIRHFPWPEMQLATMLWSGRWSNIDIRFCSIGGYPRLDVLYGTHFAGLKPWRLQSRSIRHYARFPDFRLWYQLYASMYLSNPLLREIPALKRLWEFCR